MLLAESTGKTFTTAPLTLNYARNIKRSMRYKKGHKDETRKAIIDAAGRSFREFGYQAGSVDKVMNAAGLTAGGFYAHFKSKDDLFAQTLNETLSQLAKSMDERLKEHKGIEWIRAYVRLYLSKAHLKHPQQGCPLPPLLSEISRTGNESKAVFAEFYKNRVSAMAAHLKEDGVRNSEQHASSILCLCIGSMSIARSVIDTETAESILASAQESANHLLKRLSEEENDN